MARDTLQLRQLLSQLHRQLLLHNLQHKSLLLLLQALVEIHLVVIQGTAMEGALAEGKAAVGETAMGGMAVPMATAPPPETLLLELETVARALQVILQVIFYDRSITLRLMIQMIY